MGLDMPGMVFHERFTFCGGLSRLGFQIGGQGDLGIYHDVAVAGQLHDHVRSHETLAVTDAGLFNEVAVILHAGQFRHPFEGNFPPAAAHMGFAQGAGELSGFPLQGVLAFHQGFYLLQESAVGFLPGPFKLPDLMIIAFQRFVDGFDQGADGFLAGIQIAGRLREILGHSGSGQVHEGLVVVLHHFKGDTAEEVGQVFLDVSQTGGYHSSK